MDVKETTDVPLELIATSSKTEPNDEQNSRKRKFDLSHAPFRYGNYPRYYGRRIAAPNNNELSANLEMCQKLPEPFFDARVNALVRADVVANKRVLDIGCNDGSLTLALAALYDKHFFDKNNSSDNDNTTLCDIKLLPRKILGVDIDNSLISRARAKYRLWMQLADGTMRQKLARVKFEQSNYVLSDEKGLQLVKPDYDTILALSVTKWIHLNWGDRGIKMFFQRAYRNLVNGGKFLVEPQSWDSYGKAKKAKKGCWNAELEANYRAIELKPDNFADFLTSLGFEQCGKLVPSGDDVKAGFDREILIFQK